MTHFTHFLPTPTPCGLAGKPGSGFCHVCGQARNDGDRIQETVQRPRRWWLPCLGPWEPYPPQHLPIPCRCWVQSSWVHSVLVMGYGGLTSLFNLVVLAWALRVLNKLRAQEKAPGTRACRDTVTVLGLTVLLGTTWALAFFSFSVFLLPQLFLFTIFNSLYGRACGQHGGNPWGLGGGQQVLVYC